MALLKVTNDALLAVDKGMFTVVILLDYSAAFDTVDHAVAFEVLGKSLESHLPANSGSVAI